MSDIYQATYDAVRSRIHNGDVGAAVESVLREAGIGHYIEMAAFSIQEQFLEFSRPFVTLRPKMFIDGNQWCALYGDNLQDGVTGFGDTPAKAATDFDVNWLAVRATQPNDTKGSAPCKP